MELLIVQVEIYFLSYEHCKYTCICMFNNSSFTSLRPLSFINGYYVNIREINICEKSVKKYT